MNFSVFNPNDSVQAMQLMMLCCGAFLGFRCVGEHAKLECKHWVRNMFEAGHLHEGKEFYAIQNMPDKTSKLSATNPVVKDRVGMRVPVKSSFGRIIRKVFCQIVAWPDAYLLPPYHRSPEGAFQAYGSSRRTFSPNQPIGEHSVRKLIKLGLRN